MRQTTQTKKGFTLIELLMIVTIISLLASIILTNFSTMRASAQRSSAMTEARSVTTAIESCMVDQYVLYCGGSENAPGSSSNCAGTAQAKPVAGTAICGKPPADRTEETWPHLAKYRFAYAGYAGSDRNRGRYVFGFFRDTDENGISDNGKVICCSNIGCRTMTGAQGSICRSTAGISAED